MVTKYSLSLILFLSVMTGQSIAGAAITPPGQLLVTDPIWYEEPSDHNTFDKTDLTQVEVNNNLDDLILEIPFQSDWAGLILHVLIETEFDTLGAVSDPFSQPVFYEHEFKPDYVLTSKYSMNDYGDFRRWNASLSQWDFWIPDTQQWIPEWQNMGEGNIQESWVSKESRRIIFRIPWTPLGQMPDSLMVEVYLTQDDDGVKRSAFDSVPPDATLDLDFDYENPQPGDWDIALGPVFLASWSPSYQVVTVFPATPYIHEVAVDPMAVQGGENFNLIAEVIDGGDGIGQVSVDLSAIGGGDSEILFDDGHPSSGDRFAGDGIFSLIAGVAPLWASGRYELEVRAYGTDLINFTSKAGSIFVEPGPPILYVEDFLGDDHGPNQLGTPRKYYTYPTNSVFVPGAFDLTDLTVYEAGVNIGGVYVDMIAFQVGMGDFPDPNDPGNADWSPLYADLNIQKIDILIDSGPGGATATLPWRQAAFLERDAWDYAVIIGGWYKALVPSMGQNDLASWRANALRDDRDILLVSDPELDTVTAFVSLSALGDPTPADILRWDIVVCMAGKDFGGEEVLGGVRWVEEAQSEWQFGGGQSGDRDSNYMDLLLIPGSSHEPGLPQEEILDYNSPPALDRLARGLTPVAIEITQAGVSGGIPVPTRAPVLSQNSPNPFNPGTTIVFEVPDRTLVNLQVFDVAGRLVRVLLDTEMVEPGRNVSVWNGQDDKGRGVAAGVYFYRLEAGKYSETKRMTMIK